MDVRVETRGWRRRLLAPLLLVLSLGFLDAPGPGAARERFDQTLAGIAIDGYDPVAYFTQSKAVKGSDKSAYVWLGATWHFAKAEHRELFIGELCSSIWGYCTSGIVGEHLHRANPRFGASSTANST